MIYIGKPAPDLARQIEMSWLSTSEVGCRGKSFYEIFPDGNVDLIFRFSTSRCQAFLFGPATEKASVEIDHLCDYFCIRFRPGQAPRLAEIHPAELNDSYVEPPKILGLSIDSLGDRLHSLPTIAPRQLLIEELLRMMHQSLVRDERCRWGAALIDGSGGQLQVGKVARELGVHVRSLERLFLDHLGMTPKRLTRVIRLQHLLARMRAGDSRSLADLSYACGFTDQSHMSRDFKELTGRLPSEVGSFSMQLMECPQTGIIHKI